MNCLKFFFIQRVIAKRYYKIYNRLKFRFVGIKLGNNSRIYNSVYLECSRASTIIIKDRFLCTSGCNYNPLSSNRKASIYVTQGGLLKIGNNVGMSSPTIWCSKSITIGDNTHIGANCMIIDTDVHSMDYRHRVFGKEITSDVVSLPIDIGEDVWIGLNCIILKGVTIGSRSVIGAGSVVTRDIPEDSVAVGNPCKVIRKNEKCTSPN